MEPLLPNKQEEIKYLPCKLAKSDTIMVQEVYSIYKTEQNGKG